MPDVSNADLRKLIFLIMKKVDIIEGKLDILLEERHEPTSRTHNNIPASSDDADDNVDEGLVKELFNFDPISNDNQLHHVSELIEEDEQYTKNLVRLCPCRFSFWCDLNMFIFKK